MRHALEGLALVAVAALFRPLPAAAEDAPVEVRFLTAKEAAAAIVDDSMEPYFSILQPPEMAAKTGAALTTKGLAAQRDECRARYKAAVREFTDGEKEAIGGVARAVTAALKTAYSLFAATPWSFLKVDESIEGGMPHTRGPHVVLPAGVAAAIERAGMARVSRDRSPLAGLLIHEQCHVLQRAKPALFADLYTKVWGLVHAAPIADLPPLATTRVVNPDGPDMNWVFVASDGGDDAYWQPMVVVPDEPLPRMPDDFRIVAVELDGKGDEFAQRKGADGAAVTKPLDSVAAYQKAFGAIPENFHPNETFAVLFSAVATVDCLGAPPARLARVPKDDLAKFRAWCKEHFAAQAAAK
jgi:hypothetical protein